MRQYCAYQQFISLSHCTELDRVGRLQTRIIDHAGTDLSGVEVTTLEVEDRLNQIDDHKDPNK